MSIANVPIRDQAVGALVASIGVAYDGNVAVRLRDNIRGVQKLVVLV
jgi:hypothetical protein